MVCPVDNTPLVMADRQGVEIDYCPQCRGVWLDRGELDKVIERSASFESAHHPSEPASHRPQPSPDHDRDHDRREHHSDDRYDDRSREHHSTGRYDSPKKHKREGFLGDLFDFGD